MDKINLIPMARQRDRQRRVRVRLWLGASLCYAALLSVVCLVHRGTASWHDIPSLSAQIADYESELAKLESQQNGLRPKVNEQKMILAAERSISDQPDWSLLLSYLADEVLGDQVVLSGFALTPTTPGRDGIQAETTEAPPVAVTLTGYAQTTPAVSQFVLRLEGVGLFDKVTLTRTSREPYLNGQAIAFEARCLMKPGGGNHEQ